MNKLNISLEAESTVELEKLWSLVKPSDVWIPESNWGAVLPTKPQMAPAPEPKLEPGKIHPVVFEAISQGLVDASLVTIDKAATFHVKQPFDVIVGGDGMAGFFLIWPTIWWSAFYGSTADEVVKYFTGTPLCDWMKNNPKHLSLISEFIEPPKP